MVIGREGKLLRVLFVAHPARKPVVVPPASLVVDRAGNWPIAREMMPDAPGTTEKKGKKRPPKPPRQATKSREVALKEFLTRFPAGFADPEYLSGERNPRWEAHLLWVELFGDGQLEALVQGGSARELVSRALRIDGKNTFLHPLEKARFRAAVETDAPALAYFGALAALLGAGDLAAAFPAYEQAMLALPRPGGRVDVWTIATLLPFVAQPERFLFVKPRPLQEAAARYGVDLQYKSTIGWETYGQVLKLAEAIRQDLDPQGCKDMVDVYAFIMVTQ
jgi:hypothetical protein